MVNSPAAWDHGQVEDGTSLPDRPGYEPVGSALDLRPGGVAVDRHRERGLQLTPEERVARGRNRRLLLLVAVPSILILALALIATAFYWGNEPSGPKIAAPAGYKAVSDGYFAYAVPDSWSTNPAFTDDAGDLDTSGPSGWAGEHRAYRATPLTLGGTPPSSLQAFGLRRPQPFQLTEGRAVPVNGAAAAFRYTATRPGGFQAAVIDAFDARTGVEIWLMVQAPPDVTERVLSSLRA
ncbi:MAG TPA: hypothetical protein VFH58_09805 [Acidimicrobiales bacterium]|nr:hypothetical protein [Acidimicrobiales bacterium]